MSPPGTVGVLGGTFDPVHLGHLEIVRRVRERTGFERVLFVPSAVPPHKAEARLAPARDREAMLRLAVAGEPGLEVSTVELDTGAVCYTVDTLEKLRRGPPELVPVFILGLDSLADLATWKDFRRLIREFDLLAVDRPGARPDLPPEVRRVLRDLPDDAAGAGLGRGGRIFRLRLPPIPISSSEIRARAAAGGDLAGLVPPAVAGYIFSNRLYGSGKEEKSR